MAVNSKGNLRTSGSGLNSLCLHKDCGQTIACCSFFRRPNRVKGSGRHTVREKGAALVRKQDTL
jgi:hypothetical protein